MAIPNLLNTEMLIAVIGITSSFIIAKIFYFIINKYVKIATKKTKTDLDDRLLTALQKPFVIGAVIIGIYFSLLQIGYIKLRVNIVNDIFFILTVIWAVFVLYRLTKVFMEKWISVNPNFQNMPKLVIKGVN